MIDKYFTYPISVDIFLALTLTITCYLLVCYALITPPSTDTIMSMTSDVANVAFTSAGFVLTFLTLFVSFKVSSKPVKKKRKETLEKTYKKETLFNLFLNSDLYTHTIRHLKNAVKELIIIALIGYALKITIGGSYSEYLFYYCVFGVIIISVTLWRSLLVLTSVLGIDKQENDQSDD